MTSPCLGRVLLLFCYTESSASPGYSLAKISLGDFRTTTNGRAGRLLARTGSFSGHLSKQQPRLALLDL
ncbi:hypothetical protein J6590_084630, partial [Homalodisca vitripennis]